MTNDVSQNLDIIGQVPGDMLTRGVTDWERLAAAAAGFTIESQGPLLPVVFKGGRDGVRCELTTNQNVSGGAFDPIDWDSTHFDDNSFWDAANPSRITVPTGVARMSFEAGIRSETSGSGTVLMTISDQAGTQWARQQERGTTDSIAMTLATGSLPVSAGDWYELKFFTAAFRAVKANEMTFLSAEVTRAG